MSDEKAGGVAAGSEAVCGDEADEEADAMILVRTDPNERVVLKDPAWIERYLLEGWVEYKRPKRAGIPRGAMHTCCLCDVTHRHGIDRCGCRNCPDPSGK